VAARSEPFHLDLYDVSNVEVLSELFNGVLIQDDATGSDVKRTVDSVLSIILYEGLYDVTYVELLGALDVPVNERVLGTERGVTHYLVEDSDVLVVLLAMLIELMLDHQMAVLALHALVDLRQIQDVLGGVLNHVLRQRTSLPEGVVIPHYSVNLLLLRVDDIYVLL